MRGEVLKNLPALFVILVALLIILSFVFHAAQVRHEHPETFFGSNVMAIFHSEDSRRLLAAALLIAAILIAFLVPLADTLLKPLDAFLVRISGFESLLFSDPILRALRRGSLRRKTCE